MKTAVIFNPKAGRLGEHWDRLRAQFGEAVVFEVGTPIPQGFDRWVVVGGDGTLHAVAQQLALQTKKPKLRVLPYGTGNDLSRSLTFEPQPLDLVRAKAGDQVEMVMNGASFGMGAQVVEAIQGGRSRWAGSLAYTVEATRQLLRVRSLEVEVTVDGSPFFSGPCILGLILNGGTSGGGMRWSETVQLGDGGVEIVVIEPMPLPKLLMSFGALALNRLPVLKEVHRGRGREVGVRILGREGFSQVFEMDGEIPLKPSTDQVLFTVLPSVTDVSLWTRQ